MNKKTTLFIFKDKNNRMKINEVMNNTPMHLYNMVPLSFSESCRISTMRCLLCGYAGVRTYGALNAAKFEGRRLDIERTKSMLISYVRYQVVDLRILPHWRSIGTNERNSCNDVTRDFTFCPDFRSGRMTQAKG